MPATTVFVFGAGASKGWSLASTLAPPVTRDFFFLAARESIRLRSAGFGARWPCFAQLKTIYGMPRRLTPLRLLSEGHFDDLNLEDAATRLAARRNTSQGMRAYVNFKKLIARTIGESLLHLERKACHHHDLVVENHISAHDKIVSFNYDWILERSLKRTWSDWGTEYDYGFAEAEGTWRKRKRPLLLKPHGSLDWVISASAVSLGNRNRFLEMIQDRNANPETIAIVPPVLSKEQDAVPRAPFLKAHFDHIWQRTEEAFSSAKRLVFIGYSLPRGDTQAYRTVLAAASRRRCKVDIVNPDGARLRDELSVVFGKNNVTWEFTSIAAFARSQSS